MSASSPLALEVRGLVRRFGARVAVNNVDLNVYEGDLYGFLGPNGAGKTTAMRCILDLIRRDGGQVAIFGETDPVRQRAAVGAIIEQPVFHDWLSARENLRISAAYAGQGTHADVDLALDRVGLADRANDRVRTYSQGMRQRLGIARALVGRPRILMLDEPTNGLDPRGMKDVRDLLRLLARRDHMTVFLSSHLLAEVEMLCSRVGILDQGRLVAEGDMEGLVKELGDMEDVELGVGDRNRALEIMGRMDGVSVEGEGDAGRIHLSLRGLDAATLNHRLVDAGVAVTALVPRGRRLEDLFLARTNKENLG